MVSTAATPPFSATGKDGCILIHDQPRRTVEAGALDGKLLAVTLLLSVPFSLLMLGYSAGIYPPGLLGTIPLLGGAVISAIHQAHLRRYDTDARYRTGKAAFAYYRVALIAAPLLALSHALRDTPLLAVPFYLAFLSIALGGTWLLAMTRATAIAAAEGHEGAALPRAIVPLATLTARAERMGQDRERLGAPLLFDPSDGALLVAWRKRDTSAIEQHLRAGDTCNRLTWAEAIAAFNRAREAVDLGRSRLRQLLREAETALLPYAIADTAAARSGVLEGRMDNVHPASKTVTQQLTPFSGVSMAVAKAATGAAPWPFAVAALAVSGVLLAVNHQQLLRQLRDLEGQITAQAQAVAGDVRLIADTLGLRLMPQFDGLVRLIARLEEELLALRLAEQAEPNPAKAFQLACSFREARQLLERKAGD